MDFEGETRYRQQIKTFRLKYIGACAGDYTSSRAVFLGHFAEKDDWVSETALKNLKKSLETAGWTAEFFVYSDTSHWFFESDRADALNSQAVELAWERTIQFLQKQIKK